MATLLLTAVGTVFGGPLGGAIGAFAGRQIDSALIGSGRAQGPRLKDLTVQTSSYGAPLPLHFGRMRAAGTVIWSTELMERCETRGGGKGRPSATTYSYTASFAVALASRPIRGIGRIWADGNLLRGAVGDLKASGAMRVYTGHGDQTVDPLIAQAEGLGACPAFRHTAYVVFEELELADFGNRLPSLTFEILADDQETSVADVIRTISGARYSGPPHPLAGFSIDRGTAADAVAVLNDAFPMSLCVWGPDFALRDGEPASPGEVPQLPPPVRRADLSNEGDRSGFSTRRAIPPQVRASGLRYYDIDRDYQPGLQRSGGRSLHGEPVLAELPAALSATDARALADAMRRRSAGGTETMSYRIATLDRRFGPGSVVRVAGHAHLWRIDQWEWQADGVELQLSRLPQRVRKVSASIADPGRINAPADLPAVPTVLQAFELPWDGTGNGDAVSLWAATSAASSGWSGASLFVERAGGGLVPAGAAGRQRSLVGRTLGPLGSASPLLIDRQSTLDVVMVASDISLRDADFAQLSAGANRALIGSELVQFASATPLGYGTWRLSHFLRGRGGTEAEVAGHWAGEPFVLLDDSLVPLDPQVVGDAASSRLVAAGLGDDAPVFTPILNPGIARRPLSPVHARLQRMSDGSAVLGWVRRARGAWYWRDEVETPLNEQTEDWEIQMRDEDRILSVWRTTDRSLRISPGELAEASAQTVLELRQIGSFARSQPLVVRLDA